MSFRLDSMIKDVLTRVLGLEHATDMWAAVEDMFSSKSKARVAMLCYALASTKKMTCPPKFLSQR